MYKAILIDFDDTLCYTNAVFNRVKNVYGEKMRSWGLWDEDLFTVMNDFDVANVHKLGHFSTSCFPDAFGQTYEFYCQKYGICFDQQKFDEVVKLGYTVFDSPIELMPDAEWLLQKLKPEYKLFLVTHGDIESQKKRVVRSGISQYFDNIYILEKKTVEEYCKIAEENEVDKSSSYMIGNSLRYDVQLALEAGLKAVYLVSDSWDFDHFDVKESFLTAHSLREVYDLIGG